MKSKVNRDSPSPSCSLPRSVRAPPWPAARSAPSSTPRRATRRWRRSYAKKGYLGIETEKIGEGRYAVSSIVAGSPAEKAGFQKGDVLVALNGARFGEENKEAVMKAKSALGPGKAATYTVSRAGAEKQLSATLSEVPREVLAKWVGEHVIDHTGDQVAAK